jgi:hypothetical protein
VAVRFELQILNSGFGGTIRDGQIRTADLRPEHRRGKSAEDIDIGVHVQ